MGAGQWLPGITGQCCHVKKLVESPAAPARMVDEAGVPWFDGDSQQF